MSITAANGNLMLSIPGEGYYTKNSKLTTSIKNVLTLVELGTGTNFSVAHINNFASLTVNDFIVEPINGSVTEEGHSNDCKRGGSGSYTLTKSYNASTGILTAYGTLSCGIHCSDGNNFGNSKTVAVKAYLHLGGKRS